MLVRQRRFNQIQYLPLPLSSNSHFKPQQQSLQPAHGASTISMTKGEVKSSSQSAIKCTTQPVPKSPNSSGPYGPSVGYLHSLTQTHTHTLCMLTADGAHGVVGILTTLPEGGVVISCVCVKEWMSHHDGCDGAIQVYHSPVNQFVSPEAISFFETFQMFPPPHMLASDV